MNNLVLGQVRRNDDHIEFCRGPLSYSFSLVDLHMAMNFYGHLLARFETITVLEWIKRIRKSYARSVKRDQLIKNLIVLSSDETRAKKYIGFLT